MKKPYKCPECECVEFVATAPVEGEVRVVVDGFGRFKEVEGWPMARFVRTNEVGDPNPDSVANCRKCGRLVLVADLLADAPPPMTEEEFNKNGGCACPYCRGDAVTVDETNYTEGGVEAESRCEECGRSWMAMYKVDGYVNDL